MYRNIYYNISKKYVKIWSWDEDGKRCSTDVPFSPYIYLESEKSSDAMSIFDTKLIKREFKNSWDRSKYVKNSGLKRVFYNIQAEQQYLIDTFGTMNGEDGFDKHPLKIFYLDIETYSPNGFPEPKLAPDAINVLTIYDSIKEHFYTWGTGGAFNSPDNVTYVSCSSESELLKSFIRFWKYDYPDIVSGWNSESFDLPYLINRITKILGEDMANELSPVKELYCKEDVMTKFGKREDHWTIKGVSHLDYMNVYKTFTREKREKYKLDFIGEVELGMSKNPVPASGLAAFSDNNWQDFCEYNIQDVNLLVGFEEKLHFLKIVRKLAYMGYTSFEQALGTIAIVTGAMALKALEKGMIIPTFPAPTNIENYEGGYVRDPQRGLKDGIISFDANSLYPNTIISANISPETKIGKVINKTDTTIEIRTSKNKIYEMPHDKFGEWVYKEGLVLTKAKVLYSQKVKGFCPDLLDSIYSERVVNQKALKKHKIAVKHCKDGSDKHMEHTKAIVELDVMQYTLKILMNRLYGAFANKYSPFYDIDAAASVTLTGQACIKEASDIVNKYVNKKYGVTEDCTVYGDTDSVYITIAPVLKAIGKTLTDSDGEITKSTFAIAEEIERELNEEITTWAKNSCNIKDSRFVFKRETICNSGLFLEKKRYILHVLDDEGLKPDPDKEIKYTGVEVVSIKIPKMVKPLIKHISKVMLTTRDKKKTDEAYRKSYDEYMTLDIEDVATPMGINNYEKYESLANGFNIASRTPMHVKSSIYYNHFLKKLMLTNKYEKIESGDHIKFFYVEKNRYNIKSIAFKDTYPREFGINMDRVYMFNKNITPAVERLYEAVGWTLKNPTKETKCDLLELLS